MSFIAEGDDIFRKLIDRLSLKRYEREPVVVPSVIVPVIDVSVLLQQALAKKETISIDGTGEHTAFVVPDDEIWDIQSFVASGPETYSLTYCYIESVEGDKFRMNNQTADEDMYMFSPGVPYRAYGGEKIGVWCSAHTTTNPSVTYVRGFKQKVSI